MNTAELKIDLIRKITRLENPFLIEEMQRLIDFDSSLDEVKITPEQMSRIQEARDEYRSSDTLSKSEANHEIEEWLKK